MHFPLYRWNAHALPWMVVGIALFILAGASSRRQRASRVAVLFCLMIVLVAVWFGGFAGMLLAGRAGGAVVWARVALAGVCFLPAAVYDFTRTALRLSTARRTLVRGVWAVAIVFALITLFSRAVVGDVRLHSWGWYPVAGVALIPFLILFFAVLIGRVVGGGGEQRGTAGRI